MLYLNYYYHLNHTVALGGYLGIFNASETLGFLEDYNNNLQNANIRRGYTDIKGHSVFLMPSAKLSWLNNRWCSLYSKLSAGLHYQSLYLDSEALTEEEIAPYDKSHVSLAYSVVPFGLEIGKRNNHRLPFFCHCIKKDRQQIALIRQAVNSSSIAERSVIGTLNSITHLSNGI